MSDRKAGRYELTGAVFKRAGKQYKTGDEVDLSEAEANRLARAFKPVGEPSKEQIAAVHRAEVKVDEAEKAVEEVAAATAEPPAASAKPARRTRRARRR